jgi:hypothetical protein
MRIDRTHRPWALLAAALFIVSLIVYVWYASTVPGGPRGGTTVGLIFGILGYAFMLFEGLLGARKKVPIWRLGKTQTWMRGHLWIGLVTLPMILFHAGFAFRGPLTFVLMMLFFAVYLSGIFGAALQHYLPSMITARVPLETIYEEIPHVRAQLRDEADDLVKTVASVEVEQDDKVRFKNAYESAVRPFLEAPGTAACAVADEQKSGTIFESMRRSFPMELHPVIQDLEGICEEERQLIRQRRIYHWLHVWLLVHVPLSIALLVLGGVHAILALRY